MLIFPAYDSPFTSIVEYMSSGPHPTPVNPQASHAPSERVVDKRAVNRLHRHDNRLKRGLERSAPAVPELERRGGRGV